MLELIFATTSSGGIGCSSTNSLPWSISAELGLFSAKTMGHVVIMGRKTFESIPGGLPVRHVFVLSRAPVAISNARVFAELRHAISAALAEYPHLKIFVAGGAQIYNTVIRDYAHLISRVHVSVVDESAVSNTPDVSIDTKFLKNFKCTETLCFRQFTSRVFEPKSSSAELQYLSIIRRVIDDGEKDVQTRNAVTSRLFGTSLDIDLQDGFPLLTTKAMSLHNIVQELLFFISGKTDTQLLEKQGVNIWKGNTNEEFMAKQNLPHRPGLMGPMYGYQWRHFNAPYDSATGEPEYSDSQAGAGTCVDQLANVIHMICSDPTSRRIIMTTFNPAQAREGVLYPCHSVVTQFFVREGRYLDMACYNRSSDLFLGLPYNIASHALLVHIIAHATGLEAGRMVIHLGDYHIYPGHFSKIRKQLQNVPFSLARMRVSTEKRATPLETVLATLEDNIALEGYMCHEKLYAPMVA